MSSVRWLASYAVENTLVPKAGPRVIVREYPWKKRHACTVIWKTIASSLKTPGPEASLCFQGLIMMWRTEKEGGRCLLPGGSRSMGTRWRQELRWSAWKKWADSKPLRML